MLDNANIHLSLISPAIISHNLDPHTGIPFMPHMAAHLATILSQKYSLQIIDAFGQSPKISSKIDGFTFFGLPPDEISSQIHQRSNIVFIYCRTVEDLLSSEAIATEIRNKLPEKKIIFFENIQTVNSFSLGKISKELLTTKKADLTILGEPELRAHKIIEALYDRDLLSNIPGICYLDEDNNFIKTPAESFNKNLDILPFPLWEKWPLDGYWNIGFAHAPIKRNQRFLPILTSRGCPYRCTFCISPSLNPTWRGRSGKNVADEMEYFYKKLNILDFHVSDLDPTIQENRIIDICNEIILRKLPITWKLAQGTKIETIKKISTLELMKKAGCTFISFSPESGSPDLMKKVINKPFDYDHALNMVGHMNRLSIRSQACFIAGVPGESDLDRKKSLNFLKKLVLAGIDEVAITIFTPLPGASLSESMFGYKHYSELTHSPTWRNDYKKINFFRFKMYSLFFLLKILYPKKILREIYGICTRNFETKMEMSIYKFFKVHFLNLKYIIQKK